jgi:hypothetical protein
MKGHSEKWEKGSNGGVGFYQKGQVAVIIVIVKHKTGGNILSHGMLQTVLYSANSRSGILTLEGPTLYVFWGDPMFLNKGGENLLKPWRGVAPPS